VKTFKYYFAYLINSFFTALKVWNNRQFSIVTILPFDMFLLVVITKTKAKETIHKVHISVP